MASSYVVYSPLCTYVVLKFILRAALNVSGFQHKCQRAMKIFLLRRSRKTQSFNTYVLFCANQVFHLSQLVYVGQLKKVPITLFVKWKNRISHGTEAAQAQRSRFRPRPHSTKPKTTNIQLLPVARRRQQLWPASRMAYNSP